MISGRWARSTRVGVPGCRDASLSLETYGKIVPVSGSQQKACQWAVQVKDGKFVVLKPKGGKTSYWTGDLITESVDPLDYLVTTTTNK